MNLDFILNPVTTYAVAATSLVLTLTLFISIKLELAKTRTQARDTQAVRDADLAMIRGLESQIENIREALHHLEAAPLLVRPAANGINLTKRAQALRMHRRGEPVPSIAAALETPSNEIALLLKVQSLTQESQARAS